MSSPTGNTFNGVDERNGKKVDTGEVVGSRLSPDSPDAARRARFESFAAEVYEPLQRYVRRRTDAPSVDDVVSDTLLVCWRRLDDVPLDAAIAWTLGVARRCLANGRRSERRQVRVGRRLAEQPRPEATAEIDVDLHGALAELAATDREIVLLWAWEGLEPREIALALGLTANAVSIRLHRAKKRLAARLTAERDAGFLHVEGHTIDLWLRRKIHHAIGHLPGERTDDAREEER